VSIADAARASCALPAQLDSLIARDSNILETDYSAAARMPARSAPASSATIRAVAVRPIIAQRQTTVRSAGTCRDLAPKSLPAIGIQWWRVILMVVMFALALAKSLERSLFGSATTVNQPDGSPRGAVRHNPMVLRQKYRPSTERKTSVRKRPYGTEPKRIETTIKWA